MVRIDLRLPSESDWIKVFDPRDGTIFAICDQPPAVGTVVRVDIVVRREGPRVILRGQVIARRDDGAGTVGCTVAVGPNEREKINYINGFVRGGLLNLREKRRLPIKLEVTYGAVEGPATTFTKDINEEGVFLLTERPLPETSQVHMLGTLPGRAQPLSLVGKVSHTILAHDEEPPGMGIIFDLDATQRETLGVIVKELEVEMIAGRLPTNTLE